jgi:hypothetical protein
MFKDPSGKRVEVFARRVVYSFGAGAHTFIRLTPDNPDDFGGWKTWTLSGFKGNDGTLTTEINYSTDAKWNKGFRGNWVLALPDGIANDTEFIKKVMEAYERYTSGSRLYEMFPEIEDSEGNCHTITSGALIGAGVSPDILRSMNPSGLNPGLGTPLHEMLPPIFWDMFNYLFRTNFNFNSTGYVDVSVKYLNL